MTKKTNKNTSFTNILGRNSSLLLSLSIFFVGLIISFSILHVTGGFNSINKYLFNTFLNQPNYGSFSPISNYQDLAEIIKAQPLISYNKQAKYLLIESSDLDCPNCANFHVSQNKLKPSSFDKLLDEFISTGKINYSFIDLNILKGPDKHIAIYCAAEQNPKKLFEYKKMLYDNYKEDFNADKAYIYANNLKLNVQKFKECYESKRYANRVKELSNFNSNILDITSTPTFTIYKIDYKEAIDQQNQKRLLIEYTKIDQIIGNVDYELTMRPKLKEIIETQ